MKTPLLFLVSLLSSIALAGDPPFDALYCVTFLTQVDYRDETRVQRTFHLNKKAVDGILASRKSLEAGVGPFQVGGETYVPFALLGQSSNRVYLAKDSAGKVVVLKHDPAGKYGLLQEYEAEVTEFYLSKGADVPRVIAFDRAQRVLVKEYVEGLRIGEIDRQKDSLFSGKPQNQSFYYALTFEQMAFHEMHKGFEGWLKERNPKLAHKLERTMELPNVLRKGDHGKLENFIFSVEKGRWILIDP